MFTSYLIHFELISVESTRIPLHVNIQFSQHYLLSVFPTEYSWLPCQTLAHWRAHGFVSGSHFRPIGLCHCFLQGSLLSLPTRHAPGGLLQSQLCQANQGIKTHFNIRLRQLGRSPSFREQSVRKWKKTQYTLNAITLTVKLSTIHREVPLGS